MNKFSSLLNTLFLIVAVIAIIVAVLAKIFGFVCFGLFPLSYLRFTEVCVGFVVAISLYQMVAQKQPQKRRKR
jgi:cytosine/uracil/thiamine/allantoin permease